jgi:hypothetical protein
MTKKPTKPTTKKKPAAITAAPVPSRALEHGERASGAKYLRRGFARTPELDLAFALGHGGGGIAPLRLLPDLDPAKQVKWADALPRNVVIAHLRDQPVTLDPAPIDEAEATKLARERVGAIGMPWMFLGLEAFAGPSCVLAGMLDGIEAAKKSHWNNGGWGGLCGPLKGMMLRVPEAEAKTARARLSAVFEQWSHMHGALRFDVLLHGKEGVVRSGYKYLVKFKSYGREPGSTEAPMSSWELTLLDDEPAFIAQQHEALWTAFKWKPQARMISPASARLVFLGGDAVLRATLRVLEVLPGTMQGEALDSCEDLAGPLAKQLITKLAKPSSKVHTRAQALLARG